MDDTNAASAPATGTEGTEDQAEAADDAMAALVAQEDAGESAEAAEPTEDADDEGKPSKAVRSLQKRIDKLTARNKAYEAKFGPIDGDTAHAVAPAPAAGQVEGHPDLAAIDSELSIYEGHLRWLDEHPEGGEYLTRGGEVLANVPPEKVATMRRAAERKVSELTARRAARAERIEAGMAQQAREFDAQAVERYPWLNNPEAPEHQQAVGVLNELPAPVVAGLRAHPKARLYLGALVEGMKVLQARKAAPAPRPTPPKVMGAPATAAPRVSPQDGLRKELAEAEAAFEKSGRSTDHKRVLTLRRQLRRAG